MDELAKAIRGAGIGLFTYQDQPNYQEAIPTKVLEYMASGIPVVGSDFPTTRAILKSAGCGELYPPGNMQALKGAIKRMASDGEGLARMARAGREAYLRNFRWEDEQRQMDWHLNQMPES
jgi:glycosyltransferase involved in cell wall biosynthesis